MKEIRVLILGVLIGVMIGGCAGIKEKFTGSEKEELVQTYIKNGQDYENKGDLVQALRQCDGTHHPTQTGWLHQRSSVCRHRASGTGLAAADDGPISFGLRPVASGVGVCPFQAA